MPPPQKRNSESHFHVKKIETYREVRQRALFKTELTYVRRVLLATGGNVSKAARLAGIDRKHFWRLMQRTVVKVGRKVRRKRPTR